VRGFIYCGTALQAELGKRVETRLWSDGVTRRRCGAEAMRRVLQCWRGGRGPCECECECGGRVLAEVEAEAERSAASRRAEACVHYTVFS
jgi:hypothetical protein